MWIQCSQLIWCQRPLNLISSETPTLVNLRACGTCHTCRMLDLLASEVVIRVVGSLVMVTSLITTPPHLILCMDLACISRIVRRMSVNIICSMSNINNIVSIIHNWFRRDILIGK